MGMSKVASGLKAKSVFRICLAILFMIAVLLTLIRLLSHNTTSMPSFYFLNGRKPAIRTQDDRKSLHRATRDIYSFQADFNNVCADANTELSYMGFLAETLPEQEPCRQVYRLLNKLSDELVTVTIRDKHKSSEHSTPDFHAYEYRDGWVSVEIALWRRPFWTRQNLTYVLHKFLQGEFKGSGTFVPSVRDDVNRG